MLFLLLSRSLSIDLPLWPKRYHLIGTWKIPYGQISQPFLVTTDTIVNRQAVNVFNGLQHSIVHAANKYSVSRQVSTIDGLAADYCTISNPTGAATLTEYLPTNSSGDWFYIGIKPVLGRNCHFWRKSLDVLDWFDEFYATVDGLNPIRFLQNGTSLRGSHPALYLFDIDEFGPTIDEFEFYVPPTCQGSIGPPGPSFGLSKQPRQLPPDSQQVCANISEASTTVNLPLNFSWRDTPSVVPRVRDQATCGSCWAVAASEAVSAQLNLRFGRSIEHAAGQFVDCTWGGVNFACNGGEGWEAYGNFVKSGANLTTEDVYPYIGIGGYCPKDFVTDLGFGLDPEKPCLQFRDPDLETHQLLKWAVYTYGPLMVSIRAGTDPFVNLDPKWPYLTDPEYCDAKNWAENVVDHGVLLTGWRQVGGKNYLEIMNSWSPRWGAEGFGYIDEEYDCGIRTMVLVPRLAGAA
jgi:hypothetical protein